jgi:hypothetical protein
MLKAHDIQHIYKQNDDLGELSNSFSYVTHNIILAPVLKSFLLAFMNVIEL